MSETYRLDDLARRADVASTTVRLYQAKGLLAAPRLEGRTGWYDESHLRRLRLIARLQADGYSLASIGHLIEQWNEGRSLDALVGVEAQLDELLGDHNAVTLDPAAVVEHFPPDSMTPDLMQRAAALDLIRLVDDGRVRVADRRFLDAGSALAHLGVPLDEVLDEWEALVRHTDALAADFIDLFERHLLPDDWADGLDGDRATELTTTLARLQAIARQVLIAGMDDSLRRAGRARLGALLPEAPAD